MGKKKQRERQRDYPYQQMMKMEVRSLACCRSRRVHGSPLETYQISVDGGESTSSRYQGVERSGSQEDVTPTGSPEVIMEDPMQNRNLLYNNANSTVLNVCVVEL